MKHVLVAGIWAAALLVHGAGRCSVHWHLHSALQVQCIQVRMHAQQDDGIAPCIMLATWALELSVGDLCNTNLLRRMCCVASVRMRCTSMTSSCPGSRIRSRQLASGPSLSSLTHLPSDVASPLSRQAAGVTATLSYTARNIASSA